MQGSMLVCKKSLIVYGLGLMSVVAGCSAFDDDYNSLLTKVKHIPSTERLLPGAPSINLRAKIPISMKSP